MTNTKNATALKTDADGNLIITEYNNGTDYAIRLVSLPEGWHVTGTTFASPNWHLNILDAARDLNEALIDDIENLIDAGDLDAADALGDYQTQIVRVFNI